MKYLTIKKIGLLYVALLSIAGGVVMIAEFVMLKNIHAIQFTWDRFEQGRSEKALTVNSIRRELGYGGMIHHFKNYLLRQDGPRIARINEKLGGALSAISRYRSLGASAEEEKALVSIEAVLKAYGQSLRKAEGMFKEGKLLLDIDRAVKVEDKPALAGLNFLDARIEGVHNNGVNPTSKPRLLSDMRRAIGYGGMIHHFKNYLLRRDSTLIPRVMRELAKIDRAIDQYAALGLTDAEQKALDDLRKIVGSYGTALKLAERLVKQKMNPVEIDRVVRIDDGPALKGFNLLTREIHSQSAEAAENMNLALVFVSWITYTAMFISLGATLGIVFFSFWMIRTRIVGPIVRMTGLMTQLSEGNLDVPIPDTGLKTEIGEMTRALEVFKNTALETIRFEARRREQEGRFRLILDNAADAIITIDQRGNIESCNQEAIHLFDYSLEEMKGRNIKFLMPQPFRQEHDGYLDAYLTSGNRKIIGIGREVEGLRKNGTVFPMDLKVGEIKIDGKTMFTGIIRDISERKQAEKMKDEFVSTVSHELRTPLTSIRGSLDMILSGALKDPAKISRMVDMASKNTDRLINLVNDLLDMEKIQSGKMEFHFEDTDLKTLLERSVEFNAPMAEKYGIKLHLSPIREKGEVMGDGDRIIQVITNLLSNAIKFSPKGAEVKVSMAPYRRGFRISVDDHGPGIPEEFRKKIFERFSQADGSDSRAAEGTGLGLSISKAIVEKHGGTIQFETIIRRGSTFHVYFPENTATDGLVDEKIELEQKGRGEKPNVLHIEDDPDLGELFKSMVNDEFNYTVAKSFSDAKQWLSEQVFDLVILDPGLPDGDGLELISMVKNSSGAETPMVIYSSDTYGPEVVEQTNFSFLKTRTSNEELLDVVRNLIKGG